MLTFQRGVATWIQRPVALLLNVIPATRLDPLVPPSFTPMPTPTATPPPSPTATATATATAAPTATASPTRRPTPGFAVLANTNGRGAYLRSTPGGPAVVAVGGGTPVILLGERVEVGGRAWAHVLVAGRPSGWIALDYLQVVSGVP